MPPPNSTRREIVEYLLAAKATVDDAVQASERGIGSKDEINAKLREAARDACSALDNLYREDEHWRRVSQGGNRGRSVIITAIREIILGRQNDGTSHFERACLPATAAALVAFGYQPPEEATEVVAFAHRTCDALNAETFDFAAAASRARTAVKNLADVTCQLARYLREKAENREWWRARLSDVVACIKEVGKALIPAAISAAVAWAQLTTPNGTQLTPAGNTAIEIVGVNYVEQTAEGAAQTLLSQQRAWELQDRDDHRPPNEMEAEN